MLSATEKLLRAAVCLMTAPTAGLAGCTGVKHDSSKNRFQTCLTQFHSQFRATEISFKRVGV